MKTFIESYIQTSARTKTVLSTFSGSFTAADLEGQMNLYMQMLQNRNIKGKRIAVLVPHVFSYVSLILAINKLEGVVVPLSLQYRTDDLKEILGFLDPHLVFTMSSHGGFSFADAVKQWAQESENHTLLFESEDCIRWQESAFGDTNKSKPAENPELDFICFTSGSTGVPKGLMLKTTDILGMAQFMKATLQIRRDDRYFATAPASSIMGIAAMLLGFKEGAEVIFPDSFEMPLMIKLLQESKTNKLLTTPSILKALYPFAERMAPQALQNLEICGLSGEVVTEEIAKQFPFNDSCGIFGIYGCTEMGGLLYSDLRKTAEWSLYDGVEYKIEPDGEFLIRTPHGFMGYYKRPDLTSEVWTSDAWFQTGDLIQRSDNHTFEIIGRKKDLIKKGGQQVVPAEVEKILLQHPNVKQAVVFGAPHPVYGEQIVAFTVLRDGTSAAELYPFCAGRIARYKVPDALEVVSEIPTVQGKADKITLRKMFLSKEG